MILRLLLAFGFATLAACSTVESRIEKHRAAYDRLTPAEQRLVAEGEVREGMPKAAVMIAWGRPDDIRQGSESGRNYEVWTYYRYSQRTVPDYEYVPRRYGPYFRWESLYRPRQVTQAGLDRRAVFERGVVISWEMASWR
jgi:hypothetical protein